jgi:hypothetical protein
MLRKQDCKKTAASQVVGKFEIIRNIEKTEPNKACTGAVSGLDPGSPVRGNALTNDLNFSNIQGAEPYQSRFGPSGPQQPLLVNN